MTGAHTPSVADEKNASLTMKLVAKSGYRSEVKTPAISPNQWGAIMGICEGKDACARMLASADLLAACQSAEDFIATIDSPGAHAIYGQLHAAIARATSKEASHG